ncbi:MAG: Septum site-determining protein DivIVA [Firmicutes bacterium ADurb.Bin182]|nr:MAG: Septum site-determining protein DivIVA [Firmicutes bacterium ADurb.Bin182]
MNVNDIINKHFSRVFRGYDIQEVDAFLDEIIEDYEAFEKNNELMIMRINALLDEIERLENLLEKQNLQNKQQ